MAAIAPITLPDPNAVDHTYNPVATTPNAIFRETGVAGVPTIGEAEITFSMKRASALDGVNRVKITAKVPVLETPSGGTAVGNVAAPTIAYFHQVNVDFMMPNRGTSDDRMYIRKLLAEVLKEEQMTAVIENLETFY